MVNIWASWCGPCRSEYPFLASASARYGRQVAFLGVDVDDSASSARAFLAAHPVAYPSYSGSSYSLGTLYEGGNRPATIFISAQGKIRYRHLGAYDTLPAPENDVEHFALNIHG